MNIVLEGPDASGKSTLAKDIARITGWPVQSSEGPEKFPDEINHRINKYIERDSVIFDRHPVVSQPIYSQFNNTGAVDPFLINKFYGMNNLFIYCARDSKSFPEDHHNKKAHDTDAHLSAIKRHDGDIIQLYEDWAMQHALVLYRIGDSKTPVLNFIAGQFMRATAVDMVADIEDFHQKFRLEYNGKPRMLPSDLQSFRFKFLDEELREYKDYVNYAAAANDPAVISSELEGSLDSLVDLVYVALGTAHLHGFNFREAWRRVHMANMKKVRVQRVEQSSRGSMFDVVKPRDWTPPSHRDLVEDHAHR